MTCGALRAAAYASSTPRVSGSMKPGRTRSAVIPGRGSGGTAAWPGRRSVTTMRSARTLAPATSHGIVFMPLVSPRRPGRPLASRQPEREVAGAPPYQTRDQKRDREDPEYGGDRPGDLAGEVECDYGHRDERADDPVGCA